MDINEMIRAQMKSGMSAKEIANAFIDALNKAQEEVEERASVLDHFRYIFNGAVSRNQFDVNSAVTLFAMTLANKHPEWTGMHCHDTAEIAEQTPDELADLVVNKSIELLDKLLSDEDIKEKKEEPDLDEEKLVEFLKMFH